MSGKANELLKDLSSVPSIIGALGLSIANAQKAFNLDYLENVEKLIAQAKSLMGSTDPSDENFEKFQSVIESLIVALAPSRYQFTETTLTVRMDLAQTFSRSEEIGLGADVGAMAITAAMSSAFGYDYRAAAEVRTVLHAVPADLTVVKSLLSQAAKLNKKALELPAYSKVDSEIYAASGRIFEHLVNKPADPIKKVPETSQA